MLEYLPVIIAAFTGSILSFFCGFGLGTMLLPAFLLFFPVDVAIAASAVVHMLTNIFKLVLVGKHADKKMVKVFGLPSAIGAIAGALLLTLFVGFSAIASYSIGDSTFSIQPMNLLVGLIIIGFAFFEIHPSYQSIHIAPRLLPFGGFISGFFGGLSGHQGALRSAFLMKTGLSKEAFIGTRVVIACIVDLTRISIYATQIKSGWQHIEPRLVIAASLAAFAGAWLGNKWMKKTEIGVLNIIISISLIVFGVLLASGIIS